MKPMFRSLLVTMAIALLLPLAAVAQSNSSQSSSMSKSSDDTSKSEMNKSSDKSKSSETMGSSALTTADKTFIKKAAEGGMAEVELGNLAKEKATNSEVKQFGERMVNDHSKANEQLKSLASQKGVTLPTALDPKDEATKDRLSKLSGEQFDRAYMQDMVKDHTKDVSEFKKESTAAKDPDVKSFASQTLPTLEDHLKEARQIAPKVKETASTKKSSGQ